MRAIKLATLLISGVLICAQHATGDTDDFWLGRIRLLQAKGLALRTRVPEAEALWALGNKVQGKGLENGEDPVPDGELLPFLRGVGGIGFRTEASNSTCLKPVAYTYWSDADAVERLEVIFADSEESETLTIAVPAWQLVPIVRYAESEHTACFTLFSGLADASVPPDSWAVSYHPEFENTLLGLRLMQADLIAFLDEAADCPRMGGEAILAWGEAEPNVNTNLSRFDAYSRWMADQGVVYQSYVITDREGDVSIVHDGQGLSLTGHPTWLYWYAGLDQQTWVGERLSLEFVEDLRVLTELEIYTKWTDEYIAQRGIELRDEYAAMGMSPDLEVYYDFSDSASDRIRRLDGICPIVYRPLVTTMRLTALFRYIQRVNPELWERLYDDVSWRQPAPFVDTPEVLDRSALVLGAGGEDESR